MKTKEDKFTVNKANPTPGHGSFHGARAGEKPKDLIGSWKKLISYSRRYIMLLVVAILCASIGTVFTLIGPNKLADLTDTITAGIAPDEQKIEQVVTEISTNTQANLEELITKMTAVVSDREKLAKSFTTLLNSGELSVSDLEKIQNPDATFNDYLQELLSLPENVLEKIFPEVTVKGKRLSTADKVETLVLLTEINPEDKDDFQRVMRKLPNRVKEIICTEIAIDGVRISSADQIWVMNNLTEMKTKNSELDLQALDKLPVSVSKIISSSIDMKAVIQIGLTLVVLYVLSFLLSVFQGLIMATVTQKISKQMRSDITKKINRLPMWQVNRMSTGDILSRVTNDVDTIGQSLNMSVGNLLTSTVLFLGCLVMMVITDIWMTLATVLSSLLGFFLTFVIMGKSQKYFVRQQRYLGQINGHIEEMYTGHTVVKAYNGEEETQKTFDEMNRHLRDSGFKAQCLSSMMMPIMFFTGNLGYVAVCVVGSALVVEGKIGFGVIVAFMMYVRYFSQALSQLAQSAQSIQSAAAAGERVFEFLETEEMKTETPQLISVPKIKGQVEFKQVRFGYEDSGKTIIHNFSALAKPGQKIAIVGPTGAGKTTIVNLLMRFHEIQGGQIFIDGIALNQMSRETLRSLFCMVLQETWLFEGTVRENLIYNTPGVSESQLVHACQEVGIDHFIRTLPDGYDTVLNDQVNLSQGQKQQLTIARAMIADKPMLILDEATSSVDTRTELQIQAAMDKLMQNRTAFVIAHRLSTIKNSDLILVMQNGDIIESGTHEELLAQQGFYAQLYNTQFEH